MKALLLCAASLLVSSPGLSASFMPENNLRPNQAYAGGGLNEQQFDSIVDELQAAYAPIIAAHGGKLTIQKLWTDDTVNADSEQTGTDWNVNMYGGLARRAEVTPDGFRMVICHELGHHLGGFPFYSGDSWAANEGQADTHATGPCAYKIFGQDMAAVARAAATLPQSVKDKCDQDQPDNAGTCYRIMAASKSLADLLGALEGAKVSFDTPDQTVVTTTNDDHPAAQCRLDTYVASALCGNSKWDYSLIPGLSLGAGENNVNEQNEAFAHSCSSGETARPACWFAAVK